MCLLTEDKKVVIQQFILAQYSSFLVVTSIGLIQNIASLVNNFVILYNYFIYISKSAYTRNIQDRNYPKYVCNTSLLKGLILGQALKIS